MVKRKLIENEKDEEDSTDSSNLAWSITIREQSIRKNGIQEQGEDEGDVWTYIYLIYELKKPGNQHWLELQKL